MALAALLPKAKEVLKIKTEKKDFFVISMTGYEHLGVPFEYTVELVGALKGGLASLTDTKPPEVDPHDLVGTKACVTMDWEDAKRYFSGYITSFRRGPPRGKFITYTATMKPFLWFATRTKNSRIFQSMNVKDVVSKVLDPYNGEVTWKLDDESVYKDLDYCVQYNETDFAFVSRLLEEAGIYYFFEHDDGKHTLVLTDALSKHDVRPSGNPINWAIGLSHEATMLNWEHRQEVRSAKAVVLDRDYISPTTKIKADESAADPISTKVGTMEWFEFPGRVVHNAQKPDPDSDASDNVKQRATVLMEELTSLYDFATGTTNAADLAVGMTFELKEHPSKSENAKYLVVAANFKLEFADHEAIDDLKLGREPEHLKCHVLVMKSGEGTPDLASAVSSLAGMGGGGTAPAAYRSERSTPKPIMYGPQTATVVCSSGNEIETDKHGRIKVQFHWDRDGKNDENSSCYVRVAQPWAGNGFGFIALPRKGHEVVVSFIDGDPDRPLITGSVYNGDNVPIYKLPDHATITGLKTQSSKGGDLTMSNELRFDDNKDKEYLWFQAQKDYFRHVKNNAFDLVEKEETIKVVESRYEVIGKKWYMDIGDDVMHHIGKDLHVNVAGDIFYTGGATVQAKIDKDVSLKAGGDLGIDIGGKTSLKSAQDINVQSEQAKITFKTSTGDVVIEAMNVKIKGATNVAVEATAGASLKCGGSFVNVGPSGVDISGPMVNINSGGSAGSADSAPDASPKAPEEAKKPEDLTKSEYDDKFKDPLPKSDGGNS
jgi:type VI secretion system secreted protein VgrG